MADNSANITASAIRRVMCPHVASAVPCDYSVDFASRRVLADIGMRYSFVTAARIRGFHTASALVVAFAVLSLAAAVEAETIYRWRDNTGRLHFSNRTDGLPANAQVAKLPEVTISYVSPRESPRTRDEGFSWPARQPECEPADPYPLIRAITSRLQAVTPQANPADLTLFVAGTPVWYSSSANVQVLPASATGVGSASDQAAVAYPASGGCPRTPPLERYAATSGARASSGLCADYRRGSEEIEIALSRNQNVASTFRFAAANYRSLAAGGPGFASAPINIPPWVVQAAAGQNAELAAEVDDVLDELTVAREEIDRAAALHGCW